jgi:acylphosphatase
MEVASLIVRAKFIVSGRVQGATYRDKVEELVFRNFRKRITGEIRNLKDGTVRIICEGEKTAVERFHKAIRIDRWPIVVEDIHLEYSMPSGRFKGFKVIGRKATNEDILERLDLGMAYMSDMKGGIDLTTNSIKTMNGDMRSCFIGLDDKYGEFGQTLKGMAADIRVIRKAGTGGKEKPANG